MFDNIENTSFFLNVIVAQFGASATKTFLFGKCCEAEGCRGGVGRYKVTRKVDKYPTVQN